MVEFDNNVFEINPEREVNTIKTPLANISIIDNYYKYYDKVLVEMYKLPYSLTDYGDEDMFDARKSYAGNISGTVLPYVKDHSDMVADIIGYDGNIVTNNSLIINCNRALSDKHEDYYYNAHTDMCSLDTISTVIMLNESYDDGEGMNTYNSDQSGFPMWLPRTDMELNTFIQGKPNRAILFSALLPHGAAFNTRQYREQMRYTQVIFTSLK